MTREAFVSRQIEGKGIGVIALRNIKQGELIISEEPLLIIPWWVRHSIYPGKDLEDTLSKFLEDLPEDKYQLFMSLSDCKSEEKSEIGIWRTNNFALGPTSPKSSNGIFPTIARFNHSCYPSAEFVWNEKKGQQDIRAIRDIQASEEITLCYFTSKNQLEKVEQRKQYLLDYYGFECCCHVCSLKGEALVQDESLRSQIQKWKDEFDDLVYEYSDIEDDDNELKNEVTEEDVCTDLKQALNIGLQRLDLMNQLSIKIRSRLNFCDELLEAAYDCSQFETAKVIGKKGFDIAVTLFGTNHPISTQWKSKL